MPLYAIPSAWTRRAVFVRDKFKCRYCGCSTTLKDHTSLTHRTVDHLIPRSMGGRSTFVNLVTACKRCNDKKGSLTLKAAKMTLRPTPKHTSEEERAWYIRVYQNSCVNCGRMSRRSHTRPSYHGGPRHCLVGDSSYMTRHHYEHLKKTGAP